MSLPNTILVVDWDSPGADFDLIYGLPVGYVFKYTKNVETLFLTIQNRLPLWLSLFRVRTVDPGTQLYTLYGDNTVIVMAVTAVDPLVVPNPSYTAPLFVWRDTGAGSWHIQIATDSGFTDLVVDTTVSVPNYTQSLGAGSYYFRCANTVANTGYSTTIPFTV